MKAIAKENRKPSRRSTPFLSGKEGTGLFGVQTKLTVGETGDIYEREADFLADMAVSRHPVQRQTTAEEEVEETVQMQSLEEEREVIQKETLAEEEESLQMRAGDGPMTGQSAVPPGFEANLHNSKGGGSALPTSTRAQMESAFGTDFGNVRVHTDSTAVQMSRQIGARAFTHGNDIYFNQGKYNTDSTAGQHLIAHELAHTIQQGASVQPKRI